MMTNFLADLALQPAEELFNSKVDTQITFIKFKYILENFTNKSININSLLAGFIDSTLKFLDKRKSYILDFYWIFTEFSNNIINFLIGKF